MKDDYSNGTFLEGEITISSKAEAEEIKQKFLSEGEITLYENLEKYRTNILSKKKTTIKFSSGEFIRTQDGWKTKKGEYYEDYQYYFWLKET